MSILRRTGYRRRRQIVTAGCCLLLVLLAGCPYQSPNPLGSPAGAKIDEKLLGKWALGDEADKEAGTVTISRFNDSELLIVLEEKGKPQERQMMRAFVTQIDGAKFLNLQEMKGSYETRKWIFVKYAAGDCSLTYRPVNDSVVPKGKDGLLSSEQLSALLRKNQGDGHIYDEETTLTCLRK
jgi:hypothetical protein